MSKSKRWFFIMIWCLPAALPLQAMKIEWTRMTARWPVETMPTVIDIGRDGQSEILTINRNGQLLLWDLSGKPIGAGQDGCVLQLPEGRWTSPMVMAEGMQHQLLLTCSVEGLLVAIDETFHIKWQVRLAGQTTWGRAIPLVVTSRGDEQILINDLSGAVTSYSLEGRKNWSTVCRQGGGRAPLALLYEQGPTPLILVPGGKTLLALNLKGEEQWQARLDADISTQPLVSSVSGSRRIFCGTKSGSLYAFSARGDSLWRSSIGDEVNLFMTEMARKKQEPLLLCTGLWGNLFAIDYSGRHVWTSCFRSKTRSKPVLYDANQDGVPDILVAAFNQHLYAFDQNGNMVDDVRLCGTASNSPLLIKDGKARRTDVLVTTSALLEYRLRAARAESQYGAPAQVSHITIERLPARAGHPVGAHIRNPEGALVQVNLQATDLHGKRMVQGALSARTSFTLTLPAALSSDQWSIRVQANDVSGRPVADANWQHHPQVEETVSAGQPADWRWWSAHPYKRFDETKLQTTPDMELERSNSVKVHNLYQGEIDQAAFIVASSSDKTIRARVIVPALQDSSARPFTGSLTVRQVIPTGTVNGETVGDALPEIGDAGVITVPPQTAVKLWLTVATFNSAPGLYRSCINVISLHKDPDTLKIPLQVQVLDLAMPKPYALTLCTWDYVPNQWFKDSAPVTLDDMTSHGVNVFPRSSCIPPGTVQPNGELVIDWSVLDSELDRLHDRGTILFQLVHPPLTFPGAVSDSEKRKMELRYLHSFRDHLLAKGRDYSHYGFYPLDEPGLHYGKNVPILVDAATLLREADPQFRVYTDPVPGLCRQDFEQICPLLDIWCPNMRLVSGLASGDPRMQKIMQSGKPVWSYECVSQPKSLSPLCYNRANAWRAKFFGLDGIGFWTHSTTPFDIWFTGKTLDDEYALVYPGQKPVASVRWEAVRDGLEDITALALLQEKIKKQQQNKNAAKLVSEAMQIVRRSMVDVVELSDGAFVESRDYLAAGDRLIDHTDSDVNLFDHYRAEVARLTRALDAIR